MQLVDEYEPPKFESILWVTQLNTFRNQIINGFPKATQEFPALY